MPYQDYDKDTTLPAYFVKADASGPGPAVVMFDGLDNAKEMSVLFGGVEIASRGIHVLAIDGPGQGEALRLQGIPSRYDYEVPGAAALDYLIARGDVDPKRVAVMGFSMGGYYAPRAAVMEPRFAACVAWGGHFDYYESWQRRLKVMSTGGTRLSAPGFQLPWVLGMPDMDACMKKLEDYRLDGVAQKMRCPFYCIHGYDDNIVQLDFAQRLYDAVGSADKTLKVLNAEDGGSEHCQEDNRQVGVNLVADWLARTLEWARRLEAAAPHLLQQKAGQAGSIASSRSDSSGGGSFLRSGRPGVSPASTDHVSPRDAPCRRRHTVPDWRGRSTRCAPAQPRRLRL